ncbi:MAG: hypothetical protein [Podoviridae sp. ctQNx1]|nr:MAG: hypothetical protein [Podoviridae sp. ctQNx1]UOF78134.1 hypothetical protein [Caudoviricetes sp.]
MAFDLEALLSDPMIQVGLSLLGQRRQPGENIFTGVGRGAMQGMGNVAAMNEYAQRKTTAKQQQEALEMRKKLVERIRGQVQPRPLAFNPQEGDEQVRQQYDENQIMADAIAAGASPDTYMSRTMAREQAQAALAARMAEAQAARAQKAEQFQQTLEERKLSREQIAELRKMQIAQTGALRGALSQNVNPVQVIGPDGNPIYVHPSQAYGKSPVAKTPNLNIQNEQKRQSAIAALEFADTELKNLDKMIETNPRSIGPFGLAQRGMETAVGTAFPNAATPAIDTRNKQMNILATIRKRISDSNASNRDITQALEIIGGNIMTSPGATRRAIADLRKNLSGQKTALEKVGGPSGGGGGNLTPAEQRELDELRRRFGSAQ